MFRSIGHNLARLADFSGRQSRALYWPYAISVFVSSMVASLLVMVPVMTDMMHRMAGYMRAHPEGFPKAAPGQPPVFPPELMPDMGRIVVPLAAVNLVSVLLYAAATVRRLHDRDRTGWWAAMPLPFQLLGVLIGRRTMEAMTHPGASPSPLATLSSLDSLLYWAAFLYLIVLLVGEPTKGPNRFGDAPPLS